MMSLFLKLIFYLFIIDWNSITHFSWKPNECNVLRQNIWFLIILWKICLGWNPNEYNILIKTSLLLIFWCQLRLWPHLIHFYGFCLQRTTKRKIYSPPLFLITKWNNWYLFYVRGCYSTMKNTIFFIFPYNNKLCKKLVLLFHHKDNVDVGYNDQVDNTTNLVVQNNHGLKLMLHKHAKCILVLFH